MDWIAVAARTLHFVAAVSLTGVFAFECLIAGPAVRRSGAGFALMAGLRRHLWWLAAASLALALVSGAAWLAVVAARVSGKTLALALSHDVLGVVLTRTRFGEDWLLRLGIAVLLACCLAARRMMPARAAGRTGWAALVLAALLLASLAWAGHGGATGGAAGDVHLAGDILHLLGAGMWLGTMVPLALLLAQARRKGDANWLAVARIATRRYSILAMLSVSVLLAGGLVNTWFLAGTVPALVGTGYGRLLLAKIALFVIMLLIAAVNLLRLAPRLAGDVGNAVRRTVAQLRRNALGEATVGLAVLAIVGILGTLPPGLHAVPGWPFPFRFELDALAWPSASLLAIVALSAGVCATAIVIAAAAGHYRRTAIFAGGLAACLGLGWLPLRAAIEPAYPTSFYASAEPYAAASVVRGATVYAENCAICHGVSGRGDGPAAAGMPVRPADLTEPHLFAHPPGDLFWWVSQGKGDGAMPGFAAILPPSRRWDVINFIRARAAGILTRAVGPEVTAAAAPELPDFVFAAGGAQQTLSQTLKSGPVLLILLTRPAAAARLRQLAAAQPRLAAAGLHVIAVGLGATAPEAAENGGPPAPFTVAVSSVAASALALFRDPDDGGETELMLDRAGNVRARWTRSAPGGLASAEALVAAAARAARFAGAAPSHGGHAH